MATSKANGTGNSGGPILLEDQNRALVQRIQSLKDKKSDLEKDIHATAALKVVLEEHIQLVKQRIARAKQTLEAKTALRAEYHQVIEDMDQAYNGLINESVQLLEHIDLETFRINDDNYYAEQAKQKQSASSSRAQEPPSLLLMTNPPPAPAPQSSSDQDAEYAILQNTKIPKPNNTPTKAPPAKTTPTKAMSNKTTAVRASSDTIEVRDQ